MTIIPATRLSRAEAQMLGVNVVSAIRNDRLKTVAVHNEASEAPTIPVTREAPQVHQAVA